MSHSLADIQALLQACVTGDSAARDQFQATFGDDIYNFPVKIYGLSWDEAGDFYVYVFEEDRIFLRLRTFAGRNNIQFRTFLSYYALKHLFLEWQRTRNELETISLHTPLWSEGERTLEDILPADSDDATGADSTEVNLASGHVWAMLSPEEQLDVKLLSLLEYDLDPDDIRLLSYISQRSIIDTLHLVSEVQERLKRKDQKLARLREELDSTWGWIVLREKAVQEIRKKFHRIDAQGDVAERKALLLQQQEIERALAKRRRQRERILTEIRSYKMTTPYKDIAHLLNLTVGTVCSRVFRLRARLAKEFDGGEEFEGSFP